MSDPLLQGARFDLSSELKSTHVCLYDDVALFFSFCFPFPNIDSFLICFFFYDFQSKLSPILPRTEPKNWFNLIKFFEEKKKFQN